MKEIDQKKRGLSEARGKMYGMFLAMKLKEMYEGPRQ